MDEVNEHTDAGYSESIGRELRSFLKLFEEYKEWCGKSFRRQSSAYNRVQESSAEVAEKIRELDAVVTNRFGGIQRILTKLLPAAQINVIAHAISHSVGQRYHKGPALDQAVVALRFAEGKLGSFSPEETRELFQTDDERKCIVVEQTRALVAVIDELLAELHTARLHFSAQGRIMQGFSTPKMEANHDAAIDQLAPLWTLIRNVLGEGRAEQLQEALHRPFDEGNAKIEGLKKARTSLLLLKSNIEGIRAAELARYRSIDFQRREAATMSDSESKSQITNNNNTVYNFGSNNATNQTTGQNNNVKSDARTAHSSSKNQALDDLAVAVRALAGKLAERPAVRLNRRFEELQEEIEAGDSDPDEVTGLVESLKNEATRFAAQVDPVYINNLVNCASLIVKHFGGA